MSAQESTIEGQAMPGEQRHARHNAAGRVDLANNTEQHGRNQIVPSFVLVIVIGISIGTYSSTITITSTNAVQELSYPAQISADSRVDILPCA